MMNPEFSIIAVWSDIPYVISRKHYDLFRIKANMIKHKRRLLMVLMQE